MPLEQLKHGPNFGHKQEDLQGIGIFGDPGIAQAIRMISMGLDSITLTTFII
jgi:hypothetical protein